MNKTLVILIVITIVLLQFIVTNWTCKQIKILKNFVHNINNLHMQKFYVDSQEYNSIKPSDLFSNTKYLSKNDDENDTPINYIEISLIACNVIDSTLLEKILNTINVYLIKNKGAVSDFHLIKDIVERNCDTIDEEINYKLPVPIYLGLAGTVLGIIVGLFSLNSDPQSDKFILSIPGLIDGVKFAMICSFVGLSLTTYLSAWYYRDAKAKLENQKNDFYSFIQTELLPILSQDVTSTIQTLQTNLQKFNDSFGLHIKGFGEIMDNILLAFKSQMDLVEEMKNVDVVNLAEINAKSLRELRLSLVEFEKFNQYLDQMNDFVLKTTKLTNSVDLQLSRTGAIEKVVTSLEDNILNNQKVMEMLSNFLERVDENKAIITATTDIDDVLSKAIEELRNHVEAQISDISVYTTSATSELEKLVNNNNGNLDQLKELSKLGELNKSMSKLQETVIFQNDKLINAINSISNDNFPYNVENNDEKIDNNKNYSVHKKLFLQITCYTLVGLSALIYIISKCIALYHYIQSLFY